MNLKKINYKRILILILLTFLTNLISSFFIPYKIGINNTDSIHCKIFVYKPVNYKKDNITLIDGMYILFKPPMDFGILGDEVWKYLFIKKVGAIGGEYLNCNEFGCFKNGKHRIGFHLPEDKFNSAWQFYGFIPDGYFAPIGESKRSYDVRFAGLVPINRIKGIVVGCLWKQ